MSQAHRLSTRNHSMIKASCKLSTATTLTARRIHHRQHITHAPAKRTLIKMSAYNIANLPRMSREKLAELVRAKHPGLTVIDVRDSDYIGGHILNGINVPVASHDYRMPELVRTLKDKDTVVFHCALSQQRGPSSALRYLREKERLEGGKAEGSGDGQGVVEGGQTVYVLEGGFVKWQEV